MIKKPDTSKLLGFKLNSGAAVADKVGVKGGSSGNVVTTGGGGGGGAVC